MPSVSYGSSLELKPGKATYVGCPLEWAPMRRTFLLVAILLACTLSTAAPKKHTYLFAWCGDIESKASDFLAVIDADPASPQYGKVLESLPTGVAGSVPHHTEVEMPAGGLLMANGFEAGRTWIFDLREPLKPRIVTSFGSLGGYMHPHTFFRLTNGNVLATFQYHGGARIAGYAEVIPVDRPRHYFRLADGLGITVWSAGIGNADGRRVYGRLIYSSK
jgi:56kDa selenium binding protein (SBP56)